LRHRRLWLYTGHGLLVGLIFFSLAPSTPSPVQVLGDKLAHLLVYAMLMTWYAQILARPRQQALAAAGLVTLGLLLELLQGLGGVRQLDWVDAVANTVGVALGWLAARTPLGRLVYWLDRRLG
jgi:VanZ family protein